ncbi:MarR family transcriptional regulator [Polynucleobacter aenigmaticus]|uniref:MarR family transcriptional regulator n=1 Tax=Polynucleobacter aenigmaticus TaxID=1743164 RepID=A0A254Q6M1_9BURK|nr:MarR family transcriptional regulator [Polynucleobacter aenigmaticus]OWS72451.1 MarR family transcriptional regulator [Polynucleobacter aenigmaticus]
MNHLLLVKGLVQAYQAFEAHSGAHIKKMGLTTTQFDIVATLGNQPPMTCKELGEKTLVSKGTMTGVLERLEAKGLIEKLMNVEDGRSYKISLSKGGDKLFRKVFPEHVEYLGKAFGKLSKKELEQAVIALQSIKSIFN